MTSKFQKMVGAVKDQTSISLAALALRGTSTTLEVAVLKATSHDEVPVNDRYATEVLLLASSSPTAAATAALALRRRIARSSSWVVALKTLTVIYTTILDAGPDFRRETALHRLLDLSSFRSSPWDFTAFVRTYALYLDARLQSSLQGYISLRRRSPPTDMKPAILLDRIQQWQGLLERAIGTRPTGPAKTNRLVHISLCSVIRESFDLYHDVAGGISLLLDNFFQLPYPACVTTVEACRKTARLFEDLEQFYELCKEIGIGRASEYPAVQKVSRKLLDRLNEFLKERQDSASAEAISARANKSPRKLLLGPPPAESVVDTVVERRRGRGASLDEGQMMLETESLSPNPHIRRTATAKSFNHGQKPVLAIRKASARVEEEGKQKNSFEKSAWIQNRLDESERQQLVKEQQLWLQHQNRIMERNLAFL